MSIRDDQLFKVGVVTGTHGLRGDMKVRPLSSEPDTLLGAEEVCFSQKNGKTTFHQLTRAVPHKGNVLLRLRGLDHINEVEALVGSEVFMRVDQLPDLPEDEYYWQELKGMSVSDRQRGDLGDLEGMFSTGAHDVYIVRGRYGEIMIPVVSQFIIRVDREQRQIEVDLPEGLVPESDEV